MELISSNTRIDFVGWRKTAMGVSGAMMLLSLLSLMVQGLNFGIDFAGGTLVQIRFKAPPTIGQMRSALSVLDLGDVVIQEFGTPDEILVRVERQEGDEKEQAKVADQVVAALQPVAGGQEVEVRRVEFVGPQVGKELTQQGIEAVLYSMVAILIYVAWRFEMRFAYGAVLALVHDVTITLGLLSLMHREFTLVVVAALLTVIGYSLNDTIVVYDRIREEMKRLKKTGLGSVVNEAVNRTLSRTLITSLTTVLVLVALILFGGEVIFDFALTLFVGIVVGTYSSIFVASNLVLALDERQRAAASAQQKEA